MNSVLREGWSRAFAELLDEFEGERATCAFVTVDCRRHEDEVRSNQIAHKRKWDSGGLVNYEELGLAEDVGVLGLNVLQEPQYGCHGGNKTKQLT